jgi:hypothetical protein
MKRRFLCLLCALLLVIPVLAPAEGMPSEGSKSFDFDFTFTLNAHAFPKLLRSRMAGYAALINRLGLRGNIAWTPATESMELNAVLYFTDNPSKAYPFCIYGAQPRVFITSPLLQNEVILLNMAALLEFAVKAKKTLGIPLPYLAYLYPLTTDYAMAGPAAIWKEVIGSYPEGGQVTEEQLRTLTQRWSEEFMNNPDLQRWISALADGSDNAQAAVEYELTHVPDYIEKATGFRPITVTAGDGSEVWTGSNGETLFARSETEGSRSMSVTLPASQNGYVPFLTLNSSNDGTTAGFKLETSLNRDPYAVVMEPVPAEESYSEEEYGSYDEYADEDEAYYYDDEDSDEEAGEYGEYNYYDEYGESGALQEEVLPASLLHLIVEAEGLPVSLPADSDFNILFNLLEKIFPNYGAVIHGETKKDGSLLLTVRKPDNNGKQSEEIFRCTGTLIPAEAREIPNYMQKELDGVYNVFSFNEQKLADFRNKVLPPLIRSIFSFVEAAPTSACQSLLDDLTDSGILDMVMKY